MRMTHRLLMACDLVSCGRSSISAQPFPVQSSVFVHSHVVLLVRYRSESPAWDELPITGQRKRHSNEFARERRTLTVWRIRRRLLIYEGHDVTRTPNRPGPKEADQPLRNPSGSLTQNGLFAEAAAKYKNERAPAEQSFRENTIWHLGLQENNCGSLLQMSRRACC
jgi:hypothetical protein